MIQNGTNEYRAALEGGLKIVLLINGVIKLLSLMYHISDRASCPMDASPQLAIQALSVHNKWQQFCARLP